MVDVVTIGLYSTEIDESPGYNTKFLEQLTNILKIRDGLTQAALAAGNQPPTFILSLLLIPNWEREDNSYTNNTYLERKKTFFDESIKAFQKIPDLQVQDYYSECKLSENEKEYLHELKGAGSNADMIKTRAIIDNIENKHLQLDSNTIIPNFSELYNHTFNAPQQRDGLNASFYDIDYVSAHNKMVYTTPHGDIALKSRLEKCLQQWCDEHKHDYTDKTKRRNSIYARVFNTALNDIDYTIKFTHNNGSTRYAATLNPDIYWLTKLMVTAVNMSWGGGDELKPLLEQLNAFSKIPPIPIGKDGLFDFPSLANVIKKHTKKLDTHSKALKIDDNSLTGEESRKLLINLTNNDLELVATRRYYLNIHNNHPELIVLLSTMFKDTESGNELSKILFNMSVSELHQEARDREMEFNNSSKIPKPNRSIIYGKQDSILDLARKSSNSSSDQKNVNIIEKLDSNNTANVTEDEDKKSTSESTIRRKSFS